MANLTAIIGADTSKFVEEVKAARYMLNKFVKNTQSASSSVKDNVSATKEQVQAYSRVISQLEKVSSGSMNTKQQQAALTEQIKELKVQWQSLSNDTKAGAFGQSLSDTLRIATEELDSLKGKLSSVGDVKPNQTLKRELRVMTNELEKLTAQYRAMSAAEKQSAQGQALSAKMDEIRKKAGELTDTIGDVNQEIKVMASDTPNLDVFNDVLGIGADLLSTYSSILAKVTGDEDALKDAIATVMAVQSAANLMTKIANAIQSSSAIMLKKKEIQEGATTLAINTRTAAEGKGAVATKAATAAQKAFNLVAKANPYILLATAILGTGAALFEFTKYSRKSEAAEKANQEAAEKAKQVWEDYRDTISNSGANLLSTYGRLRAEWNNLKTESEKNQWIIDNKKEFDNLGVSIDNVSDAENFLVNKTSAVVEAFSLRAKAAAQAALASQAWKEYLEKEADLEKRNGKVYKDEEVLGKNSHSVEGGYEYLGRDGKWRYTQKGAQRENAKRAKQNAEELSVFSEKANEYSEDQLQTLKESNNLLKKNGIKRGNNTKNNTTEGSKSSKSTPKPTEEENKPKGLINQLNQELDDLKKKLIEETIKPDDIYNPKTNQTVRQRIEEIPKLIEKKEIELGLKVDPEIKNKEEATKKLTENLTELAKETDNIEYSPKISSFDTALGNNDYNSETLDGIKNQMDLNDSLIEQLNNIKNKYAELGITSGEAYDKVINKIKKTTDEQSNLAKSAKSLKKKQVDWEEQEKKINKMRDTTSALGETFGSVGEVFSAVGDDTTAAVFNAVQTTTEAVAQMIPAIMSLVSAKQAEAIASATAAGAPLPPPANIAAIASGVAAVIAAFAKIGSFADGGIIGGNSTVGDYNIARVNKGEMIMNGTQQKRLFNLLDGTGSRNGTVIGEGGNVKFKIKGNNLYGVLRNHNLKQSRI